MISVALLPKKRREAKWNVRNWMFRCMIPSWMVTMAIIIARVIRLFARECLRAKKKRAHRRCFQPANHSLLMQSCRGLVLLIHIGRRVEIINFTIYPSHKFINFFLLYLFPPLSIRLLWIIVRSWEWINKFKRKKNCIRNFKVDHKLTIA